MKACSSPDEVWAAFTEAHPKKGILGISGFGGAGKTTLAESICARQGVQLVKVDDYLDWPTICTPGILNLGVDFEAIKLAHINPFLAGTKPVNYLVIEGIYLFASPITEFLDFRVWISTSLEDSSELGRQRAKANELEHDKLWDIWTQNEDEFYKLNEPDKQAHLIYSFN